MLYLQKLSLTLLKDTSDSNNIISYHRTPSGEERLIQINLNIRQDME